jgi:hypothetical protein
MYSRCSLLFALLALGAPAALHAQGEAGLKAGVSFGNISNKEGLLPGKLGKRTGFAGGIYLGFHAWPLGFGIEGLYDQRGAKSDSTSATVPTKLDYVDVPVYVKVALPTPLVQPFAYAGPQVSFEVRCRHADGTACVDADSTRKKTDYAGVVGAGVRFGGLGIEGRYIYGFRDLKLSTVTSNQSYKTRTFMILVSIGRS